MVLADSFYYQPVQIDTINTRVNADLFAKEGDANGRGMVVQITENGIIKDTTGITLRLQWSHISVGVSGFTEFEVVDATKGLYKLVYPTSMLHRGRVEAFIRITDNGILSGTRNLMITVERMVGSDETIEASDDFSALQAALIQLDAWNVTIGGKVGTWEADMEATKQLYIDTLAATEAAYPQELVSLKSELAQTESEGNEDKLTYHVNKINQPKAYMAIVDDDARTTVLEKLKPIADEKNIPITLAVPVEYETLTNRGYAPLSKEQLLDLQNSGWEMASHSLTHSNLRELSNRDVEQEVIKSRRVLESWGLNIDNIVYPYGSGEGGNNSAFIKELSSKYYRSGTAVGGGINTRPIDSFKLNRVALGAFTGGKNTLEYYKQFLDSAIENNGWVIYMTHCHEPEHDETQQQHLRDLIDYAKANNVEIVNLRDGYEAMGNVFEVEGSHYIGKDGKIMGPYSSTAVYSRQDEININTLPKYFNSNYRNKVVYTNFNASSGNPFPESNAGTLMTCSVGGQDGTWQEWIPYRTNRVYKRYSMNGSGTSWSDFALSDRVFQTSSNAFNNNTPIEDYKKGVLIYTNISPAGNGGFPHNQGLLVTDTTRAENGQYRQQFKQSNTRKVFERFVRSNGTWSEWEELAKIRRVQKTLDVPSIEAHSHAHVDVDCSEIAPLDFNGQILVTPNQPLSTGFLYVAWVQDVSTVRIRVVNHTAAAKKPNTIPWNIANI